jgi:hypothetical protein
VRISCACESCEALLVMLWNQEGFGQQTALRETVGSLALGASKS